MATWTPHDLLVDVPFHEEPVETLVVVLEFNPALQRTRPAAVTAGRSNLTLGGPVH